jgi:hypothetical protein
MIRHFAPVRPPSDASGERVVSAAAGRPAAVIVLDEEVQ